MFFSLLKFFSGDKKSVRARSLFIFAAAMLLFLGVGLGANDEEPDNLDVPYEPSHPKVVKAMLEAAKVTSKDIVYDLGCGDGRIAIAAARKYGARAVGVDLSKQRIEEAREKARHYGVDNKVKFIVGDIMKQDISKATVVTLYLLVSVNKRLRPILFRQLKPGTRVVSHAFHMSEWKPDRKITHKKARKKQIFYWVIPAKVTGNWNWKFKRGSIQRDFGISLNQNFQKISGSIRVSGESRELLKSSLSGVNISLQAGTTWKGEPARIEFSGKVKGNRIVGSQKWRNSRGKLLFTLPWNAARK